MKSKLFNLITALLVGLIPGAYFAQAPSLGTAANFVLFTTSGALTNTGISQLTGNVGTNSGSITGFGNVNGKMLSGNGETGQCATDLLAAYNVLDTMTANFFPAVTIGNGDTFVAGVYYVSAASTLNGYLYLDAENDANAEFVIQVEGTFASASGAKVKLINGAQACNVFWKIEGMVSLSAGTSMKGNIIVNNAAISMNANDTLEGRAMTTTGAITLDGVMAYTPVGCGSPTLVGPAAPNLGSSSCYVLFSSDGSVANTGATFLFGDVGTNVGLTTGFDTLNVNGTVHPIPDGSTAAAAADLLTAYTYMNSVAYDIELLYPAQFGNNLVLTPHTYLMNSATTFTDSLYLNAMGDSNAVFLIKIYGALSTSTYSKVILINGAKAKNVYWLVSGAVEINDYSEFKGTLVCNNGAIDLNTGVNLLGRALTTTGAFNTAAIIANMPTPCSIAGATQIITQPLGDTVCAGSSVSFFVVATGDSLTYQWRKGTVNLVNNANTSGVTTDTLTIDPASVAHIAGNYNVIVTGDDTLSDTSEFFVLAVNAAPTVTTTPANQSACSGQSVTFTVVATGVGLTYQWRKGTSNLTNGGAISGVTTASLTINPVGASDVATNYNVVVSGACSPAVTSSMASLSLNAAPAITTQPSNQTACSGASISMGVAATGTTLTYQWRKGTTNLSNGGSISGATSATLTINPLSASDAAANYNVVVSGACTPSVTSANATVTVNDSPTISVQPVGTTVCEGSSVNLTVTATGTALTYQWRKGTTNLSNGGSVSGATTASLTINPIAVSDDASNYNVVVSGTCSPSVVSSNVTVTVNTAPEITTQPADDVVCAGESVDLTLVATGTALTYQWRKGTVNISDGGNISGATTATLNFNPIDATDAATNYNVVVTGTCSPAATSSNAMITVNSAPEITSVSPDVTTCEGNDVIMYATATGSNLTYQWKKGNNNLSNNSSMSGVNTDTLRISTVVPSEASNVYNLEVSGGCQPAAVSANIELVVYIAPVITLEPVSQVSCEGSAAVFTVAAYGTGISFQWKIGDVDLINGGNISGATSTTLTISPVTLADTAIDYNVVVYGTCTPHNSELVSLTVHSAPVITIEPMDQAAYTGTSVSFSVEATGGNLQYQWRKGTVDLNNGGTISGANSSTLNIDPLEMSDTANNYNVVITGSCTPSVVSKSVALYAVYPLGVDEAIDATNTVTMYPNPFRENLEMVINTASDLNQCDLVIYDALGNTVIQTVVTKQASMIDTYNLSSGIYFYQVFSKSDIIQTGKLIAQ